jgi:drug/metabolite transporter (DMT)-like permease
VTGLLGLGPAIVLTAGALAAVPAGRLMDRFGRVPVLAAGFGVGAAGCGLAALGSARDATAAVLAGLVGIGTANGATLLARTAAGDMYPPQRRARGIALVLFGAVFGAILGPAVFSPLLAERDLSGDALAALWLAAAGFELVGLALVAAVRPDPKTIAALLRHEPMEVTAHAAPIGEVLRRPGVVPALVAAQASWGVMVGVMTLTGAVVVDHFHHVHHDVFPIIGAHFIGMYAFVLLMGDVVLRSVFEGRVGWATRLGVLAGFMGVAMLVLPGERQDGAPLAGMLLLVGAAASWAMGSFFSPRVPLPDDPFVSTALQQMTGGAVILLVSLVTGEMIDLRPAQVSAASALGFAYLVVFGSLAFTAYTWLLQNAPIQRVATYAYVNPVVGIVLGWLILFEEITGTMLFGAAVIVSSVAFIVRRESAPVPQEEPGVGQTRAPWPSAPRSPIGKEAA